MTRSDWRGEQPRWCITCCDGTAVSRSCLLYTHIYIYLFLPFAESMAARRKMTRRLLKLWRTLMKNQSTALGHMCAHTHTEMPHRLSAVENNTTLSCKWAQLSFIRRRRWDEATAWGMKDSEGLFFFTLAPLNCFSLNQGSGAYRFLGFFSTHGDVLIFVVLFFFFIFHMLSLGRTKRLPEFLCK